MDAFEGFEDFKSGGQVIGTMKYVDKLVLMSKKERVLQDMFDRLTEIGRFCGLEMNVLESKVANGNLTATIRICYIKNNWRMWNISTIWVAC
jgi:hypothetical protein